MNYEDYMMMNKWIIEIIVVVMNGYFVVSLLAKYYNKGSKAASTPKPILYSAIASFLGFPICYTAKMIVYMAEPEPDDAIRTFNLSVVWFSFAVSRLSYYTFMLSRLYYSFRFSDKHRISNTMMNCHIGILIITPIYIAIMIALQGIGVNESTYMWGSIVCILWLALGSMHIMYTFNHKLYDVIVTTQLNNMEPSQQTESSSTAQSVEVKNVETGSQKLTRKMFKCIVQNTLLTVIINSMFVIFVVLYGIFSFVKLSTSQWTILAYLQLVTINVASLCIYLSFSINSKLYTMCCAKPQKKCEDFCQRFMKKPDAPNHKASIAVSIQSDSKPLNVTAVVTPQVVSESTVS